MSNDDSWSGADKIPPMVYVPPPDAEAPAGRGGVIGLIVLLFTIVAIVVAGLFSLENWVYSKSLANPANWASFELDGGDYGLLKAERAITADMDPAAMRQFRQNLHAQNRVLCQRPGALPESVAIPDLARQVDENRRLYDATCLNSTTATQCTKVTPAAPGVITAEQRQALCAAYLPPTATPAPAPQPR